MTPYRQKIARDAVNDCLRLLIEGKGDNPTPTKEEIGTILERLGAARAALSDHLWDKR